MSYQVRLTEDASTDLEELFVYIATNDSLQSAGHVLEKLETALESLCKQPKRGVYPQELLDVGIREYREILFKPYRMIYRTIGRTVYVYLIVDGRRDMQSLLKRRVLGA